MRQINSQLTRDKVVAELRRDILYGVLTANQELHQDKIAEELGVSRMPVREALASPDVPDLSKRLIARAAQGAYLLMLAQYDSIQANPGHLYAAQMEESL